MVIDMNDSKLTTLEQLCAFLSAAAALDFQPYGDDAQRYAFIERVLKRFAYRRLGRADKGFPKPSSTQKAKPVSATASSR
jgi:hypothetical protein